MRNYILLIAFFTLCTLSGTVYVVNNQPNTDPDFSSLSAAYAAAADGDTLYICGSATGYGDLTLTIPLTLIGPGYFLTANPQTQATGYSAVLGTITYSTGSSGSLISGCQLSRINVNTGNIIIKRNYINDSILSSSPSIPIAAGVSNIAVVQNYLQRGTNYTSSLISALGTNSAIYIANNILYSSSGSGFTILSIASSSTSTVENNIFYATAGTASINNTTFQNNIIRAGYFNPGTGSSYFNNIGNATQFGTANGNQSNVNMATVFLLTGSPDGMYSLIAGSPALGSGSNGADCGIFGGPSPYVLSGLPEGLPAIYEFLAPASGFTYPAQIKIRAH